MEKHQKSLTIHIILLALLLSFHSTDGVCQISSSLSEVTDNPRYEYSNVAKNLKKASIYTASSAPLVAVGFYAWQKTSYRDVPVYYVEIYSNTDYRLIEKVKVSSKEEQLNYVSPYPDSECSPVQDYERVRTVPNWVPWVAGGATLALAGILYGAGKSVEYKCRVEAERRKLEICFDPTGVALRF